MDRSEEDMKHVGFFGIYKQSFKTIFTNKKIFAQITLAYILPLTIIFIAHTEISHHVFLKIELNSLPYDTHDDPITIRDWIFYWLFKIIYLIFLTIFSLLSTAAIVFTIASVYTNRDVKFRHTLKIVPKIWSRLFVTLVYIYVTFFIYNVIFNIVFVISRLFGYSIVSGVIIIIFLIVYALGFLYLSVVSQLASVVTVLENINGLKAMKKGKGLLYGKKKVGMAIALMMYVFLVGLMLVIELFVVYGDRTVNWHIIGRVMLGILCGMVLLMWFLLFIVIQTVLYLVCKSFHHEAIDKLSLSTFLGAYTGETIVYPKPGEDIQLGRVENQV